MNRELKLAIEQMGREKGIAKEVLFEALESALLSASKRTMGVGRQYPSARSTGRPARSGCSPRSGSSRR